MISASRLTKSYGPTRAVDALTFEVRPGVVTGFLGPNGSGKSTTMRMVMGLDHPDSGAVTIGGQRFHDLRWPLREIGALLEAKAIHPGRSAHDHLLAMAQTNSIPKPRVDEVLGLVGLDSVARRKAGKFSLGMSQRLGIASALLGDPGVLLFDEPINGLDPEGILWVRNLLKSLAAEGRTIFVSSHLMSEMALTATDLVVIGRGRLIADTTVDDFIASNTEATVLVRSPGADRLAVALRAAGAGVRSREAGALLVTGLDASRIGDVALTEGLALHELSPVQASLEEVFMELTSDMVDFHGQTPVEVGA
ncbi:MAG TPA: ATP-binding cassette domain-containing protein [Acidimicrobiales bacterium]